jgi:hypothetical protein
MAAARARFEPHPAGIPGDAERFPRPVMRAQRFQIPIRIANDSNLAFGPYHDRELAFLAPALASRCEDLFRVPKKRTHKMLIVSRRGNVRRTPGLSNLPRRSKRSAGRRELAKTVHMVGIHEQELEWLRLLTSLLRHPDPLVPEFARQSLLYVAKNAGARGALAGKPERHPLGQTVERPSLGGPFSADTDFPSAGSMPSEYCKGLALDRSQTRTSASSGSSKL